MGSLYSYEMSESPTNIPFAIETTESVRSYVSLMRQVHGDFDWRWKAVLEHLEVAGHRIGTPVAGGPDAKSWRFFLGDWGIKVVWHFQNDRIRIVGAKLIDPPAANTPSNSG